MMEAVGTTKQEYKMQANPKNQPVKAKYIDIKMLIAALAVAVTIGFWNLLSSNAIQMKKHLLR